MNRRHFVVAAALSAIGASSVSGEGNRADPKGASSSNLQKNPKDLSIPREHWPLIIGPLASFVEGFNERWADAGRCIFKEGDLLPSPSELPSLSLNRISEVRKWAWVYPLPGRPGRKLKSGLAIVAKYDLPPVDLGPLGTVESTREFEFGTIGNRLWSYTNSLYPNKCEVCGQNLGPLFPTSYHPDGHYTGRSQYVLLCEGHYNELKAKSPEGTVGGFMDGWNWTTWCSAHTVHADGSAWPGADSEEMFRCFDEGQLEAVKRAIGGLA